MYKKILFISSAFITSAFLAAYPAINSKAQEKNIATLSPSGSWSAQQMAADTPNGYCALSREYDQGLILTLGQNLTEEYSLAIDFQENNLNVEKPYKITLQPGPGQIRAYEMMPASSRAMVIRLGYDDSFIQSIESSGLLKIEIDGKHNNFEISDFKNAQEKLATCMTALKGEAPTQLASNEFSAEKIENAPPLKAVPAPAVEELKPDPSVIAAQEKQAALAEEAAQKKLAQAEKEKAEAEAKEKAAAEAEALKLAAEKDKAAAEKQIATLAEEKEKAEAEAARMAAEKLKVEKEQKALELAKAQAEEKAAALAAAQEASRLAAEKKAAELKAIQEANKRAAEQAMELQRKAGELAVQKAEAEKLAAIQAEQAEKDATAKLNEKAESVVAEAAQELSDIQENTAQKIDDKDLAVNLEMSEAATESQKEIEEFERAVAEAQALEKAIEEDRIRREENRQQILAEAQAEKDAIEKAKAARKAEQMAELKRRNPRMDIDITPMDVPDVIEPAIMNGDQADNAVEVVALIDTPQNSSQPQSKEELETAQERLRKLEEENRQLYLEARKARGEIDTAVVATSNQALKQMREYEKKLEAAQRDNLTLSREIEELRRMKEEGQLASVSGDWDLEQSTERYNEAEREIKRLGLLLEQQRLAHRQEKKELEEMLFDPAVTDQEQRRQLAEMQRKLVAAERQLQASGQSLDYITNMPAPTAFVPRSPRDEQVDIAQAYQQREMEYSEIERRNAEIRAQNLQGTDFVPVNERPVLIESSNTMVSPAMPSANVQSILSQAQIPLSGQVNEVGPGQYRWDAGQLKGWAQIVPASQGGDVAGFAQNYLMQAQQSCQGDFASLPAQNVMRGQAYDIACVGPMTNISSSIVFAQMGQDIIAIGHETTAEDMDMAIDTRDRIAGSL